MQIEHTTGLVKMKDEYKLQISSWAIKIGVTFSAITDCLGGSNRVTVMFLPALLSIIVVILSQ